MALFNLDTLNGLVNGLTTTEAANIAADGAVMTATSAQATASARAAALIAQAAQDLTTAQTNKAAASLADSQARAALKSYVASLSDTPDEDTGPAIPDPAQVPPAQGADPNAPPAVAQAAAS